MRTLIRVLFLFFIAAAALGQSRFGGFGGNNFGTPVISGGFGNALFPAGTPANSPNVTRFTPNAVFPAGGGPRLYIPGQGPQRYTGFRGSGLLAVPFAYPVYVGGYDNSGDPPAQQPPQGQPSPTVVYPSMPPPVLAQPYAGQNAGNPEPVAADDPPTDSPEHYLIALKDHTVYPVVAYFTDGDTLHYFTAGNVHNQVSLTLVDRDLTLRLNHEMGIDMKLPADK